MQAELNKIAGAQVVAFQPPTLPGAFGLPVRVARVAPGPGHRVVSLVIPDGAVSLVAHVPPDSPAPDVGADVVVTFDPVLSAVLPRAEEASSSRQGAGAPRSSASGGLGR